MDLRPSPEPVTELSMTSTITHLIPLKHRRVILLALGVLSVFCYIGITVLSRQFNWGEGYAERPILAYLGIYFTLFVLYFLAVALLWNHTGERTTFWLIVIFGLVFRAAIFPSQQIQEDDVYRYLWDGKVFAQGINPYEYAPKQVSDFKDLKIKDPARFNKDYDERNIRELSRLYQLKWESRTSLLFMERINHPHVPTLYPPLAQYVFRLIHHTRPDSILALRAGFLLFDLLTLAFVVLLLEVLGKSRNLCLIYFWSPLLIKETFNSTHLDIIGISMLCVSLYFMVRRRFGWGMLFLSLSLLGKFYSAILFPVYLNWMYEHSRDTDTPQSPWRVPVINSVLFLAVIGIVYLPFLDIGGKAFTGLKTFSTFWQSNDSIFALLVYFYGDVLGLNAAVDYPFAHNAALFWSKLTVMAMVGVSVVYVLFNRTWGKDSFSFVTRVFVVLEVVFLVSPVQNPWYLCWLVPFFCLYERRSWVLLTGLVGLYYLDFYFDYQDLQGYSKWIPWLEYSPFYLMLAAEGWGRKPVPAHPSNV